MLDEAGPSEKQCARIGRPEIKLDDFTHCIIRQTIHDFYFNKVVPTIATLHQKLIANEADYLQISKGKLLSIVKNFGLN